MCGKEFENHISENDLYIYFEVIAQLEPESVLDAGPVLKRAGSVSRKAMNREIPETVRLDGIDFGLEADLPAYRNIYNRIFDEQQFMAEEFITKYSCAIFLGANELPVKAAMGQILQKLCQSAAYVLTDNYFKEWEPVRHKVTDLKVDGDIYYLFDFGE